MPQSLEPARVFPVLSIASRWLIVLVCLLQGSLLYLCYAKGGMPWLKEHNFLQLGLQALVLALPTAFALSVRSTRNPGLWLSLAVSAIVLLCLAGWVSTNINGLPAGYPFNVVTAPFYITIALLVFIALPWLQARIDNKGNAVSYTDLHRCLSLNIIILGLTLLLAGLMWLIFALGSGLFKLVGIGFFQDLFFRNTLFAYLANGTIVGVGILLGRTQPQLIATVHKLLAILVRGLLPLLSFIAIIFIIALPFTGLQALSTAWSAASLLTLMVIVLSLLLNVVYQDGTDIKPYPAPIHYLVNASILLLPVYALLALYSVITRVAQYGWTPERVWGFLIIAVCIFWSGCYALAVLRRSTQWLQPLGMFNKKLSLLLVAVLILCNTPIIDPYRISVVNQMQRYADRRISADQLDLHMLRFYAGRKGYDALIKLRDDVNFLGDIPRRATLERILAQNSPWSRDYLKYDQQQIDTLFTTEKAKKNIQLAKGTPSPETSWWEFIPSQINKQADLTACYDVANSCVVNGLDLNRDGKKEYILCNFNPQSTERCTIYSYQDKNWQDIGNVYFDNAEDLTALEDSIRNGKIKTKPKEWANILISGEKVRVRYQNIEQ